MSPGRSPVRLVDIAREAGVSRVAVGHVLNGSGGKHVRIADDTREKILKIARRMNYRPNLAAQQLRGARSQMIGVVLDTVNTPVMYNRLAAIESEASRRGYRLMIGQVHSEPSGLITYLDDFAARGVDGVLCLLDLMRSYREELRQTLAGRPNLVMHGKPLIEGGSCIRVDTTDAIYQAAGHLIDRGRNRVAMLLWNEEDALCEARRQGYANAHRSRNRDVEASLVWSAESPTATPDPQTIDRCIDVLVNERRADAIIAPNDVWAVRLMKRMKAQGVRVPDDVAMIGYDNLDIAEVIEPGLTSIDQSHAAYASAAIDLLGRMVEEHEAVAETVTIQPLLIVREST
ncbi:MAG: LacI family DNA-binding transcriptional regulator [Phycisphaera sp.]|nr:LacI family DNA-binding transcriptional regulator [Phycisphaera sp.]